MRSLVGSAGSVGPGAAGGGDVVAVQLLVGWTHHIHAAVCAASTEVLELEALDRVDHLRTTNRIRNQQRVRPPLLDGDLVQCILDILDVGRDILAATTDRTAQ